MDGRSGPTRTLLLAAMVIAGCASEMPAPPAAPPPTDAPPVITTPEDTGAPAVPEGALDTHVREALDRAWDAYPAMAPDDVLALGGTGDPRLAWLLTDYLRFNVVGEPVEAARSAFAELTGIELESPLAWVNAVNQLMLWDIDEFPGYVEYKRVVFAHADERWEPFFTADADVDYRLWTWGGVLIDDSPPGQSQSCGGCIPGIDYPQVTTADDGDWYPDDRPVVGVVIDGEARAYPRNIMEVHEMFNDTLGGRHFALPYCTLCGSAQLYFTDGLGVEQPVMRTSGLLSRSNKVMYDVVSGSVFDTFTGRALTGPLRDLGVELELGTVITTTWADWKAAYPDTTIVELDDGAGRVYGLDPLGERDAGGPIFPIGTIDERLRVHEPVVGVVLDDGTAAAFAADDARQTLQDGQNVSLGSISLVLDAGGLRAIVDGQPHPSHEAFWFAWSQFHTDTLLWTR